jgi:hypothetical protein
MPAESGSDLETADAFADRIAAQFPLALIADTDSMGVRDLMLARHARYGVPVDPTRLDQVNRGDGLVELVHGFYADLLAHAPKALQEFCADHVRVRGVPSFAIEGAVYFSGDGNYVVIVTTSLMTFLNKIKKFIFVERDPSVIEYCNRYPAEALTPELLRAMRDEIVTNFREGEPRGPLLMLNYDRAAAVNVMLNIQETFIVAHEIGHLLSDFMLKGMLAKGLHESFGSDVHRSEYLADMFGFALVIKRSIAELPPPSDPELDRQIAIATEMNRISSICEFFEILELAFPEATPSHPAPVDRAANILATFYGEHFGAHYNAVRAGEIAHFNWATLLAEGFRPSFMAKLCMDMLANDPGFRQLIALAETEGPDALRIRTGR